jgi:hypothetical protein
MNQILLEKLSNYLNNNPKEITINQVKKVAKGIPDKVALSYLLKEYLEYDFDYTKILNELNVKDYINNEYYKNIIFPNKKYNSWEFKHEKYNSYELFVMDDFKEIDGEILPQIGYFNKPFYYPAVFENNRLWMSITPNEINTMKQDISDAYGDVLVVGCGLLYYPYMISNKNNVKSITVIEINEELIDLANKIILSQFENKNKINIIHADAYEYMNNLDKNYDFIYIDIWHDVSDGLLCYNKFKKYEQIYKKSIFRYWIYDTMKFYLKNK